ncbi:MAG TPA: copper resistance CopC family protein [Stellaceae bacterium]|nr:copper resistance CopC family protein [Stellaceae bacterium]
MQPSSLRRRAALLITGVAFLPLPAAAHAIIVSSEPAVDAVVRPPSLPVLLRFNSRIDRERSRLTLLRPDGSSQPLLLAPAGRPDTLAAKVDGLAPGRYRLRWQVLAIDGHITRGDIPFAVGE